MAAETNGIYAQQQYGQPAELAASTPTAPSHAQSASLTSNATSTAQKADPVEVGWFFAESYYTTLSRSPEKIHLFYAKKSQFLHGVEAEKVVPAVGTKAINEKIKALDFQDCKVRVLNVDSQASFQNIVVQVIGEISNKSEPHHKFVQTFILAEQPNGYFVLNDIFRYLNLDEDEIVDDEPAQEEVAEESTADTSYSNAPAEEENVTSEPAAEHVDEKLDELAENEAQAPVEEATAEPEGPTLEEPLETTKDVVDEPPAPVPVEEKPAEPEPSPVPSPAQASTPAPVTDAPPAKKTWANMVGTKAPAVPALPVLSAPAGSQPKSNRSSQPQTTSKTPAEPATSSTTPSSDQSNGWQNVDGGKKQKGPQNKATSDAVTLAYIKNVTEKVDARILRETLSSFGELKYFDVSRPRNCAFVEFADSAGYAAAIAANPHHIGGEEIVVEERRPRPGAFGGNSATTGRGASTTSRGRGGSNMTSRTGSQSGGLPREAGRGNFQQRGTKNGGSVTPRGRGQAQAA